MINYGAHGIGMGAITKEEEDGIEYKDRFIANEGPRHRVKDDDFTSSRNIITDDHILDL